LQNANINKVNLIENAFHGDITQFNRKLSYNTSNNINFSNKNLNWINKSKNWNLYAQNKRRIKNNINIDLNNHNINSNELNNNYSKNPNAKVIIQAGINTMVNIKNIDYNMKGNIYDNMNKKPLYKSSLYENNFQREKNENSKDLFNFNEIKFNDYNYIEQINNNHDYNSQTKCLENSPIK